MPAMKLTKSSTVISDPVNQNINPKRIPGAIIRYTITAENDHATPAEGVVISDDLGNEITTGTLSWVGNIQVTSSNINSGAITNITDATGDDAGEFSNNVLSVNCGDVDNISPCIVSYDVEVTQ